MTTERGGEEDSIASRRPVRRAAERARTALAGQSTDQQAINEESSRTNLKTLNPKINELLVDKVVQLRPHAQTTGSERGSVWSEFADAISEVFPADRVTSRGLSHDFRYLVRVEADATHPYHSQLSKKLKLKLRKYVSSDDHSGSIARSVKTESQRRLHAVEGDTTDLSRQSIVAQLIEQNATFHRELHEENARYQRQLERRLDEARGWREMYASLLLG